MKIAFFEITAKEKKLLIKQLKQHELLFFEEALTIDNVSKVKDVNAVSMFIYSELEKAVLVKMPKLKLIATRSTGFDHVDVGYCNKQKITVCNVPYYGENTVAEHTFALILSLSRNVHKSYVRTLQNDFSIDGLIGFDLKGKVMGVVGAGHIGLHVIRIAKGFGMEVKAFDTNQDSFLAEVLDFEYVSFGELLKTADIISLHVPYNKHTHHLINRENIKLIKKGAILINTSRGGVVEIGALIKALDEGIIAGAGLDVLEGEELIREEKQLLYNENNVEALKQLVQDHILLGKDNVVFTPHIGFYSEEALQRILETTISNILNFDQKLPTNVVTS
ncbi:hydroxyacid dehydrogenase [Candidatus Peregrinibacteria bacterium CG11_big_fil_rev_8_21_14_0_20_41_10]|nr:MAG: hydroxyacid dehydrogenase [Candidatus Peregrinibacteria bacterium CG11_big_fil_rev_8_21_14_0_20_41_10]PIZ76632.1 MAG: hydroxyacid dehydrogenase [Candidatus Peregrinibacteria bacterium CG_4_10_14_0_2_um_filter_41_8]PJC37598.1 MAG: hydroxyacid dehydrogenase [Candidatus Peregrinibacteria bacterium CG_4_9_14_0_2_um_filter_41_14]